MSVTKTTIFFDRLEKYLPRIWNEVCFENGLLVGNRDIDEASYFPTANRVQESRIGEADMPCYTLEWQNRSMKDDYAQRTQRFGDLKVRIFALNDDDDLRITRDYLQNGLDIILQALSGHKYRRIIGGLGQVEVLSQIDTTLPNREEVSGKEMVLRVYLS